MLCTYMNASSPFVASCLNLQKQFLIKPEPNMLKILPIIPSNISQKNYP